MTDLMITVSGLRGIIGVGLTPEVAMRYACAFAKELPDGDVLVTRDGRATGRMLMDAITSGLRGVGRDVIDADIAATPTTGILVRSTGAVGGIQVSASHNPAPYNGMKLFGGDGRIIPAPHGEKVTQHYHDGEIEWMGHDGIGDIERCDDTVTEHARLVKARVNVNRIRQRRFKVMLHSNHASPALLGEHLLKDLGCRVTHFGAEMHGHFSHTPEPTEANLAEACKRVPELGVDVAFFPDPDGDRLAIVDENGRYLGEEYTFVLCLNHVLSKERGAVVVNAATSRMSEDVAQKFDVPFYRSKVGEANVADQMIAHDAVLGGEGNGGVIDPKVGYVRDSFVGMATILDAMAASNLKASELGADIPGYHIQKDKLSFDRSKLDHAIDNMRLRLSDAEFDDSVGLRFVWPDKWLLIHPSNTEPIVRVIAEARSTDESTELCEIGKTVLGSV